MEADTNVVEAGEMYSARVIVEGFRADEPPNFMFRGEELVPLADGTAEVKLRAASSRFNKEGVSEQYWRMQVIVPRIWDSDTTIKIKEYLTVVKPEVQAENVNGDMLYINCSNKVNFGVEGQESARFLVSNALYNEGENGELEIVPHAENTMEDRVKVHIIKQGSLVGTKEFYLRNAPLPSLSLTAGESPLEPRQGMGLPLPNSLSLGVIADEHFAEQFAQEANYEVSDWKVMLQRNDQTIATVKSDSPIAGLATFGPDAQAGDVIVVEVIKVLRTSTQGVQEEVALDDEQRVIRIPVR